MKQVKPILMVLLTGCLLTMAINCLAADSTSINTSIRRAKILPMKQKVIRDDEKCTTTKEEPYSVTMTNYQSAYPACPANTVVKKINFRTDTSRLGFEVTTWVSAECCEHRQDWQQPEAQPGQQPPA